MVTFLMLLKVCEVILSVSPNTIQLFWELHFFTLCTGKSRVACKVWMNIIWVFEVQMDSINSSKEKAEWCYLKTSPSQRYPSSSWLRCLETLWDNPRWWVLVSIIFWFTGKLAVSFKARPWVHIASLSKSKGIRKPPQVWLILTISRCRKDPCSPVPTTANLHWKDW